MDTDDRYDEPDDEFNEPYCHTCGGSGWVESVASASGRYGWDTDGPGDCPELSGDRTGERLHHILTRTGAVLLVSETCLPTEQQTERNANDEQPRQ